MGLFIFFGFLGIVLVIGMIVNYFKNQEIYRKQQIDLLREIKNRESKS